MVYTFRMNDDHYKGWKEGDLYSAIYEALDRLQELDPATTEEPWFQFLQDTVDKTLAPQIKPTKH